MASPLARPHPSRKLHSKTGPTAIRGSSPAATNVGGPCDPRYSCCMADATAGSGMKWVGRAIRRLEDPALVRGHGRFTADLAAAHFVRFVRSPVAAGRIVKITAPDGITVIRAADLDARPIRPMLHKFNYLPIEQPI